MIDPRGIGAVTALGLILVLAVPADGLAQFRINERPGENTNVPPRPPMRMVRPGPVVAPVAIPHRNNAAPVPPAAANRPNDHDGDRGAFAAGVAAGVVIGGAFAAPGIYNVPAPSPTDDPVAYCTWMYSSYDPQSGTYIGDDGNSHPCP
jgi:hypothetical protein